jgi:hypothetical protein
LDAQGEYSPLYHLHLCETLLPYGIGLPRSPPHSRRYAAHTFLPTTRLFDSPKLTKFHPSLSKQRFKRTTPKRKGMIPFFTRFSAYERASLLKNRWNNTHFFIVFIQMFF